MSKSKSSSKAGKSAQPDVLTKVRDSGITKPVQNVKAKAKDLVQNVTGKEDKKSKKDKKKKVVKEPTPEPSSEEEESSESSSSESESDSEVEVKTKKPVANGKANGAKAKIAQSKSSDESQSDESASDDESDAEVAPTKVNGAAKVAAKVDASDSGSDNESDSEDSASSEDDAPTKTKSARPAVNAKIGRTEDIDGSSDDSASEDETPAKNAVNAANGDEESDADSSDSSGSDSGSENDDSEVEVAEKPAKRKAETAAEPVAKKTKTESVDTSKGKNLFIGNLSWNVDEDWLRQTFEEHGEIDSVRIVTDRATGRSKGFGYVEFVNAEDAAQAHAAKKGSDLDGRPLNVDFAAARPDTGAKQENRRKSYGDQLSEPTDTLFIGNISFDVGQEQVTEAFAPYGTVMGVRLPTDRDTGAPKGFGYVNFSSVEEAQGALEAMQGYYLGSRPLRLDYSQPRPQNDSPGGRGGRGGFGGRGAPRGGRGFGGRGGRGGGGRGGFSSTNRGGFGDFSGRKQTFDG